MKFLVTIQHPAHVHFFRHAIDELEAAGHEVRVVVRDKDVATDLLSAFDVDHEVLVQSPDSLPRLALMQLRYEYRIFRVAREFRPDVITGIGGLELSHVAPLVGARSVAFNDSEGTPAHKLFGPTLDAVCTPAGFDGDFGSAHRRYEGYHELAYLHPDRFDPDPDSLRAHGVDPDEQYFLLRYIAWNAHHDVGQEGLSLATKRELVEELSGMGTVYVSCEGDLPDELAAHAPPVPPELLHQLLYHADLYVGDSQTMATEAAVLGTPAVRTNSFAGEGDMSNFVELEERYDLLVSTPDEREAFRTAIELATDPTAGERWAARRERLVDEKIDVTDYVVDVLLEEGRAARGDAVPADERTATAAGRAGGPE